MNLFQMCQNYVYQEWNAKSSVLTEVMTGLGLSIIEQISPEFEFETCCSGQPFSYLWRRLCRHYEWGKCGVRKDALDQNPIPFSVEYAPKWFYEEELIRTTNGNEIEKDQKAEQRLLEYLHEAEGIRECEDAGIRSGLWLYDELCRGYVEAYQRQRHVEEETSFVCFDLTKSDCIHYELRQWNVYAYMAHCLILFEQTKEQLERQRQQLRFDTNPVLYLLLVCTAINPVHTVWESKEQSFEILRKVECEWRHRQLFMHFPDDMSIYGNYMKQVYSLLPQLGVEVCSDSRMGMVSFRFCD